MKKNRIILLTLLVLVSGLSILYLVLSQKKPVSENPAAFPAPAIPDYVKGQIIFEFNIDSTNPILPQKVSYLRQSLNTPIPDEEIKKIATNLGFTKEASSINDIKMGPVYFYNNPNNFLTIYPQIRKIKFGPATSSDSRILSAINKNLTDNAMVAIAEDFLINKVGLPKGGIKFNNFIYLERDPTLELFKETDKNSAQIFQLNFTPSDAIYPILTLNPQQTTIYAQVLKDGTVLNSEVVFPGKLSPSINEYPIKSLEQIKNEADKAVLVSLNDSNINLPDLKEGSVRNITVEKVSLVYLLDKPLAEELLPVFLLEGKASVQGYNNLLNVSLYLPAYP